MRNVILLLLVFCFSVHAARYDLNGVIVDSNRDIVNLDGKFYYRDTGVEVDAAAIKNTCQSGTCILSKSQPLPPTSVIGREIVVLDGYRVYKGVNGQKWERVDPKEVPPKLPQTNTTTVSVSVG